MGEGPGLQTLWSTPAAGRMTNLSKCWQSHYVAIQTFQAFFFTVCEKESKSKTHEIDCCCYNESESGKKARKERKKKQRALFYKNCQRGWNAAVTNQNYLWKRSAARVPRVPTLTPEKAHIQAWTTSKSSCGLSAASSVHPPCEGDLAMLLHDIVLVVVGQRPHQAKVTDLHSVS